MSEGESMGSSAEAVAANDDLLSEILRRLPIRSIFQFKSVSKHWLSLITHPHFLLSLNPDPTSLSGLFLHPGNPYDRPHPPGLDFIPLHLHNTATTRNRNFRDPTHIPSLSDITILSSCHGLLCCSAYSQIEEKEGCHVLNPTTNQFTTLPEPHFDGLKCLCLAFDPSSSPNRYKVVSVWGKVRSLNENQSEEYYQIEIYSSEKRWWRASGGAFTVDAHHMMFFNGVYWNGSIHWSSDWGDSLYFNVEEERLGRLPMPPVPEGREWYNRGLRYQLESRDHLHIIDIYEPTLTKCEVFEMERDYSGWFVKYRVDVEPVAAAFPKMMEILRSNQPYFSYSVLWLVREPNDEDSFLLLHIPGKVIRFNLARGSFEAVLDVGDRDDNGLRYFSANAYQYIEFYSCV